MKRTFVPVIYGNELLYQDLPIQREPKIKKIVCVSCQCTKQSVGDKFEFDNVNIVFDIGPGDVDNFLPHRSDVNLCDMCQMFGSGSDMDSD